jgi:hypothetical protein
VRKHPGNTPEPKPRYVEFAGREFELVTVHPWPRDGRGQPCKCHVDLTRQRIEVGGKVAPDDREPLVRKAVKQALGLTGDLVRVEALTS